MPGDAVEHTKVHRVAVNNFLRCRTRDSDHYIAPTVRALVKNEGGVHSNGAFMVADGATWVTVPTTASSAASLADLVGATTLPTEKGGQDSGAIVDLLARVSKRLYDAAEGEQATIIAESKIARLEIDEEDVGDRHCVYTDPTTQKRLTFSPHTLTSNLERLQPSCSVLPWFVSMALQPDAQDSWSFDALDGSIRSAGSVVEVVRHESGETSLRTRPFSAESDRMLMDAGHDIACLANIGAFFDWVALPPDEQLQAKGSVVYSAVGIDADYFAGAAMWAEWFPDKDVRDFLLYSIAERLLLAVRKECHVYEAPSDRGKSALLRCVSMLAGSYARVVPKSGLDGSNRRTARVHELTLSKAGVRFILHDEADRIDWEYLKAESNGVAGSEFSIGMGETLESQYKAMRVVTKNAARTECTVRAAPIDARRKIVHVTGEVMHTPRSDAARYARIQAQDASLARGLFLSALRVFHEHGVRPPFPDKLRAGDDLRGAAMTVAAGNAPAGNSCESLLVHQARNAFAAIYTVVGKTDAGTETASVQTAVAERMGMPFLALLPMEAFMASVLHAGCIDYEGDKIVVPQSKRGYVHKDDKKQRVNSAMAVVPTP